MAWLVSAVVVGAVGTGLTVYGQIKRGEAEEAAALSNAEAAERAAVANDRNANLTLIQSEEEARREGISGKKTLGSIRAAYGASGVRMDGSPTDYLEENAAIAARNVNDVMHQGVLKAEALRAQAEEYRKQGSSFRGQADYAGSAGVLGGVAEGLSGVGKIANNWLMPSVTPKTTLTRK